MLSRIVLARKYQVHPILHTQPPNLVSMLDAADACLIIGDPALLLDPATLPFHVLDLGSEWTGLTGLPFVFAVWAAHTGRPLQDPQPFLDSLRFGLRNMEAIVQAEHVRRGITAELARDYLTRHIVFELTSREYQGLSLFLQYAQELQDHTELKEVSV